ncbi:peptidylprolyl isomerase FKBP-type [Methanosalsum zhilinae DSM 4017]|uniref:Peptidyl-prolyl cis-trans isomerase n=1 Tax=Methanosalsum zhilinae (strain DSM 4017 / NBRC 107636 / OCM 62 / WeN5) TaxID=679901 RepID=F7XNJ7_METZD|nr:FKBP-type peptidyl-prolyl cis-trans isomerase [Methanosalsum zhilinae]AEH60094.1 peptidylprolyl isomerase FKBP-type [Methanosalsum zhilinae DSM 4017]
MNSKVVIVLVALIGAVLLSGCADVGIDPGEATVERGDTVSFDYIGMYENGTVFDTSIEDVAIENEIHNPQRQYEPMTFEVGSPNIIEGISTGLIGMTEGEEKTITLEPEEAYGPYREDMIVPITIEEYQEMTGSDELPQPGDVLMTQMGQLPVNDVNETHVKLDTNHPMAGKTLVFDVTVVSIEKGDGSAEDVDVTPDLNL